MSLPNYKRRRICFGHRAGRDEAGNDVSQWCIDDSYFSAAAHDFVFDLPPVGGLDEIHVLRRRAHLLRALTKEGRRAADANPSYQ